ncbi:hypothetical protein C9374_014100 [Naegleria lovaniensis]|uniref:Peptidase C45 hydrolase domain-containing protein n=1 Tax=Naegleria lovaniensis TaxID=51637 RepID=A0AA88GV83_NAELO|nr:uncharacterized protein C9374_014100 [Naegleria lovaniensis]KAG2389540.1 hypothetical protein C9374_014100 [Naegleria lovaniensis]
MFDQAPHEDQPLPFFETPIGTFYQVGYSIGEHFKTRIKNYLNRSDLPFQSIFLPFIRENPNCLDPWIQITSELFPHYMDEIRGLADGSNTPFEWIFALNMLNELRSKIQKHHQDLEEKLKTTQVPKVGGCSEVFVLSDSVSKGEKAIIAHNEDADKSMGEYAYIVKSRYSEKCNNALKSFTIVAYHYPGTLSGNTFGWNDHLIFGTNGKSPLNVLTDKGIPRCFINRSVYESESIEEALETLKKYATQSASGFSTNISTRYKVDIHEESAKIQSKRNQEATYQFYRMCNIELAPPLESNIYISMYNVPIGIEDDTNHEPIHYAHFNHYAHLKGVTEGNVPSSRRRYERSLSFKNICDEDGVRQFLGDTKDTEFPLFRRQQFPDKGKTLATMIANVGEKKIKIYVGNPKYEQPLYDIDLTQE